MSPGDRVWLVPSKRPAGFCSRPRLRGSHPAGLPRDGPRFPPRSVSLFARCFGVVRYFSSTKTWPPRVWEVKPTSLLGTIFSPGFYSSDFVQGSRLFTPDFHLVDDTMRVVGFRHSAMSPSDIPTPSPSFFCVVSRKF